MRPKGRLPRIAVDLDAGRDTVNKMTVVANISTLFLDIGGVLLTNGWDRTSRRQAAEAFGIDFADMDERHHLTFDTYERGKITLDEYLNRVIFNRERGFSRADFRRFMFARSKPLGETLGFIRAIRDRYRLRTVVVNNEGRELSDYRIRQFGLASVIDFFVSSCYVGIRKPDEAIYRLALDIAHVVPAEVLYVDDRELFVEVAHSLGINTVLHRDLSSTREAFASHGLSLP